MSAIKFMYVGLPQTLIGSVVLFSSHLRSRKNAVCKIASFSEIEVLVSSSFNFDRFRILITAV